MKLVRRNKETGDDATYCYYGVNEDKQEAKRLARIRKLEQELEELRGIKQ